MPSLSRPPFVTSAFTFAVPRLALRGVDRGFKKRADKIFDDRRRLRAVERHRRHSKTAIRHMSRRIQGKSAFVRQTPHHRQRERRTRRTLPKMIEADNTRQIIRISIRAHIGAIGDQCAVAAGAIVGNDERAMYNRP